MKEELEDLISQCGNRFRKLTLHSENIKHPDMIWQASPNQHTSKYKRGVRGRSPCEAVKNLLKELNKMNTTLNSSEKEEKEWKIAKIKQKIEKLQNELDLIIDKLPLEVGGHRLQIWREKDETSWDVAYNTDSGNLEEIVWVQARYLSEAVDQMLKRLKIDKVCKKCGGEE